MAKFSKLFNISVSDRLSLHYLTPKFQKKIRATLNFFGGVNHQHDDDWKRVYITDDLHVVDGVCRCSVVRLMGV